MPTAKVIQDGTCQIVTIPEGFHLKQREFYIKEFGEGYILMPTDDPWYLVRNSIGALPEDFMNTRDQPMMSEEAERKTV